MKALQEEEHYDIPMTSLIDIVFLLLIFFLVATNFTRLEVDHSITLPQSEAGTEPSKVPDRIVINITREGALVVNGSVMEEDGLRGLVRDFAALHPGKAAVIRADARVSYSSVMKVFGICRGGGVRHVDLPVLEPAEE